MLLDTMSMAFRKAKLANGDGTGFPSRIPTTTEPEGDANTSTGTSVHDLGGKNGGATQNGALFVPYCLGADGDDFSMRVIGWRSIKSLTDAALKTLWVPVILVEVACEAGTAAGVAGSAVLNTEVFAESMTLTYGNDDVSIDIVSPGASTNFIAHFVCDLKGFQKFECTFDRSTGTNDPTSCNCLVALL